jgi:hypothetical protein
MRLSRWARWIQTQQAGAMDAAPAAQQDVNVLPCGTPYGEQFMWTPRLAVVPKAARPAPAVQQLATPTSSSLEYWQQHRGDPDLFNVGLVAGARGWGAARQRTDARCMLPACRLSPPRS